MDAIGSKELSFSSNAKSLTFRSIVSVFSVGIPIIIAVRLRHTIGSLYIVAKDYTPPTCIILFFSIDYRITGNRVTARQLIVTATTSGCILQHLQIEIAVGIVLLVYYYIEPCGIYEIMSSSYYSGNNSNSIEAVVVDVGAGLTKMGWAGDDYPRSIFRSVRCDECINGSMYSGFLKRIFYFLRVYS